MATISTTPPEEVTVGDYLLEFSDDDNDLDGEAGTYDECEYDEYERRAIAHVSDTLPAGWSARTETDTDGAYVVAESPSGRVFFSPGGILKFLQTKLDDKANLPGGVDLSDPGYLRSLLVPECECLADDPDCDHAFSSHFVAKISPLVYDVLRFLSANQ